MSAVGELEVAHLTAGDEDGDPAPVGRAAVGDYVLAADGITHVFGGGDDAVVALHDVSLTVAPGEFVAIVGQSGCGKSTLLNILAGLITPTFGAVTIPEEPGRRLPTVGYITQHDSLLPWRTALGNVAFPLELHGVRKAERIARGREILARVGLLEFADRLPAELSGGMRQRLSLARTLLYEPKVLLMDEPFGALDAEIRSTLHGLLQQLWTEMRMTVVLVTHDLAEAITLADRVITLTTRPGSIRGAHDVGIPRPRAIDAIHGDAVAADLYRLLRGELTSEQPAEPPISTPTTHRQEKS